LKLIVQFSTKCAEVKALRPLMKCQPRQRTTGVESLMTLQKKCRSNSVLTFVVHGPLVHPNKGYGHLKKKFCNIYLKI